MFFGPLKRVVSKHAREAIGVFHFLFEPPPIFAKACCSMCRMRRRVRSYSFEMLSESRCFLLALPKLGSCAAFLGLGLRFMRDCLLTFRIRRGGRRFAFDQDRAQPARRRLHPVVR